jgi:hypothetical protein
MELTKESIKKDIEEYNKRKAAVIEKINRLPRRGRHAGETRKFNSERGRLQAEVAHVNTLIGYAREALARVLSN